jgi:hypothetical protein
MIGGPVDPGLHRDIERAIGDFPGDVLLTQTGTSPMLVIKYISPVYANAYHQPGQNLFISVTPGFTWGRATYVTPLAFPTSTAIFGRVGVVAGFNPNTGRRKGTGRRKWRTFDATVAKNERLYLRWLQTRALYRRFALTAHSGYIAQMLRDAFRRNYEIDCVLFRPDQSNPRYTKIRSDVWMAVTDWHTMPDGRQTIAMGHSEQFTEPRITVLIEEEFKDQMGGIHRTGLLNLTATPFDPDLADKIFHAYHRGEIVRIQS